MCIHMYELLEYAMNDLANCVLVECKNVLCNSLVLCFTAL